MGLSKTAFAEAVALPCGINRLFNLLNNVFPYPLTYITYVLGIEHDFQGLFIKLNRKIMYRTG